MLIFVAVAVSKNGQGKLFGTYNGFTAKGTDVLVENEIIKLDENKKPNIDYTIPEDPYKDKKKE